MGFNQSVLSKAMKAAHVRARTFLELLICYHLTMAILWYELCAN